MLAQGIEAPPQWWQPDIWAQLREELPQWLCAHLRWWQAQAVALAAEEAALAARIVADYEGGDQPKGLGRLSAALLDAELCDWSRFTSRRAVSSYTGLCPSEYSSDQNRRQGGVSKYGNARVRHLLVEAAWRLAQWQRDYPPLRLLHQARGKRARKRAILAVARRLAVDLWRVRTGQCRAEQLGLQLQRG